MRRTSVLLLAIVIVALLIPLGVTSQGVPSIHLPLVFSRGSAPGDLSTPTHWPPGHTPTATATEMPTGTPTATATASPTGTPTATATATPTGTPTTTATATATATPTATATATPTVTPSPTPTHRPTASAMPGMLRVPEGSFEMGCDGPWQQCNERELPLHTVYLDAFYIDVLEVTNSQYIGCVDDGFCDPPAQTQLRGGTPYYGSPEYDDHPVIHVTWSEAKAFCTWAGKRLPTEAEWERAARGSVEPRVYPWGNDVPDCTRANFYPDAKLYPGGHICVGHPVTVGSYPTGVSVYGMHDMAGNVREWVNDWYQEDYYTEPVVPNPQGPETGDERVIRGGGWSNDADNIRVAARDYRRPGETADDVGFRCAADASD